MRHLGRFTVPPDHPALPGHFPGNPTVPGVVLLDLATSLIGPVRGFSTVRFTRPVRPGETVDVHADGLAFACTVDGVLAVQGRSA